MRNCNQNLAACWVVDVVASCVDTIDRLPSLAIVRLGIMRVDPGGSLVDEDLGRSNIDENTVTLFENLLHCTEGDVGLSERGRCNDRPAIPTVPECNI